MNITCHTLTPHLVSNFVQNTQVLFTNLHHKVEYSQWHQG